MVEKLINLSIKFELIKWQKKKKMNECKILKNDRKETLFFGKNYLTKKNDKKFRKFLIFILSEICLLYRSATDYKKKTKII